MIRLAIFHNINFYKPLIPYSTMIDLSIALNCIAAMKKMEPIADTKLDELQENAQAWLEGMK